VIEENTHLDLCSGIGGFALAIADAAKRTDRNVRTVAFCEPDKFCQQVLNKHWPNVPIFDDVKTFPRDFGKVDILTAGYPCQPFSQAGKRKGTADDRHIWPWVLEIVKQTRPDVAVFENVVGHISMGLDEVLLDLENEGYRAWPLVLGAVSKNAPHRRQRVWIVAYANSESEPDGSQHEQRMVAHTQSKRIQGHGASGEQEPQAYAGQKLSVCGSKGSGQTEGSAISGLGGTFNGLSTWVDGDWERGVPKVIEGQKDRAKRLKALGNAIVPQVASEIFTAIFEAEDA